MEANQQAGMGTLDISAAIIGAEVREDEGRFTPMEDLDLLCECGWGDVPRALAPDPQRLRLPSKCPECGRKLVSKMRGEAVYCPDCHYFKQRQRTMRGHRTIHAEELTLILRLFHGGWPAGYVALGLGRDHVTIKEIYQELRKHVGPAKCPCGRPAKHKHTELCGFRKKLRPNIDQYVRLVRHSVSPS